MGCTFDEQCAYYNNGNGSKNKCLACRKWEGNLSQPITGSEYFRQDITDIPPSKSFDYIFAVIRTLPKKQATVLIQRHYLNYSRKEIQEYHGFKTKTAVSNLIQRATENVLKKLKWGA